MSSRTRDIASILGKTEANNTSNIRLLKVGDAVASDEETLADINVDGGGNVDRVLGGSVAVGDAVILTPGNLVKKVGQPFERHEILQTVFLDSDGNGNDCNTYNDYSYNNWGPQLFYVGQNKFIIIGCSGTSGRGNLWARMFEMDATGHSIQKVGPVHVMQSSYYSSSTSYGGTLSNSWCAVQGENNRIHVNFAYQYYSGGAARTASYIYTVYPDDVDTPGNVTLTNGGTYTVESPNSQYPTRHSQSFGFYGTEAMRDKHASTYGGSWGSYDGGHFYYYRPSFGNTGYIGFRTTGNTITIAQSQNSFGTSVEFDDFGYSSRPWYNPKAHKFIHLGINNNTTSGSGSYDLFVDEMQPYANSSLMNYMTPVTSSGTVSTSGGHGGCYDSSAGLSVIAYRDNNNVGQLRTINSNSSYNSDPTIGPAAEFTGYLTGWAQVFHDKAVQKNCVLFTDYQANPDRAQVRWFTADSDGTISLEDSTHTMLIDSAWTDNASYPMTVHKFDDFDTAALIRFKYWGAWNSGGTWGFGSTYYNGIDIFHPERRQNTNLSISGANYLGIAQEAGDSGDTINVKIHGAIDNNQSGLIPNTTYYLNEINGDLEPNTNNGSIRAGYAVAGNQLKILTLGGESA